MEQQFIRTISEHQAIIHRVCRVYRDTLEDREDMFQEIVYQLWKAFPAFQQRSSITIWMYRISLSTAMAKYRKKSSRVRTTSLNGIEVATSAPPKAHPKQELLHRAIATLSDTEKAVITFGVSLIASLRGVSHQLQWQIRLAVVFSALLFIGAFAFLLWRVPLTDQKLLLVFLVLPTIIGIRTWVEVRQWQRNLKVVRQSLTELK